jgi:hypothetical protein
MGEGGHSPWDSLGLGYAGDSTLHSRDCSPPACSLGPSLPSPASVGLQVGFYLFIYLFILCGVVSVCLVVGPLAHFPPFQGVTMLGEWHSPQLVRLWEVVLWGPV